MKIFTLPGRTINLFIRRAANADGVTIVFGTTTTSINNKKYNNDSVTTGSFFICAYPFPSLIRI
jgi:hypothetical protein